MLLHLAIRNYATVDSLEIEFQPGMTVITGETGAGKSIILEALGFTLGDRADKTIVRGGADKAEICAEFDTSRIDTAREWLQQQALATKDDPSCCILRRVVNADGRSRAFINGSAVNLSSLKSLGELLIDIHSQHEHQSLLQKSTHQRLLDDFGVDRKLRDQLAASCRQWQQNHQQLRQLHQQTEENAAQSRLLSYQLAEFEQLDIGENEVEQLEVESNTLSHTEELISMARNALHELNDSDELSLHSRLGTVLGTLKGLPEQNTALATVQNLLGIAQIHLEEAINELRVCCDQFETNPERLEQINQRLGKLHEVARKHKVSPDQLVSLMATLQQQWERLENHDQELARLTVNDQMLRQQFVQLAGELSTQRKAAARQLSKKINTRLRSLGMPDASLEVHLSESAQDMPRPGGLESVEFLVVTNPGQAPRALSKIASGGELSRISLAIQVITAQTSQTPSLVFDEVDVGIGGGVAKTVGALLRQLGARTQLLCVTHQAQVAGQGHHHWLVTKHNRQQRTVTAIHPLQGEERIRELARMLGGEEYTDVSLAHARQLLAKLH